MVGKMPLTSLYTCSRCKREFNFENVKYDENNRLICVECLEKQKKIEKKENGGGENGKKEVLHQ